MALNHEQRKHVRHRLQEIYNEKSRALTATWPRIGRYSQQAAKLADDARMALNARLADMGVVLGPTVHMDAVQCEEMTEYRRQVDDVEVTYNNKHAELKAAYNAALDEVVLGADADAFRKVLESFNNFKID